jgi:menaquinol-cytochrome c reductase cytochrome b/c subunit
MNEEQKKKYLDKYHLAKDKGVKFYPDIVYKDLLVSFALFLLLVGLATFVGVAPEAPADPSDSAYIPRPEWYFLFLFEFLKFIPGQLEWVGTSVIPVIGIIILFLVPFLDRSPLRTWRNRRLQIAIMAVVVLGIVGLTVRAVITTPAQAETAIATTLTDKIAMGQDLYSINCVECHGPDGEGGEIIGVEGLEGTVVKAIHSQDEMYTNTDETLYNIIDYGQPSLKMNPFGKGYGGELTRDQINAIVTFMRYSWDDRVEMPQEAVAAGAIPELQEGQAANYEQYIAPIIKRYCVSCHRPGKTNNNYVMGTYQEVLTTGDHAPNFIAGDLQSNTIRMLYREEIEAGGPMPPTKQLPSDLVALFENWVMNGMPEKASDVAPAEAPSAQGTPAETSPVEAVATATP